MMLRESQIMKVHYVTAIAALFVVSVHIIMRVIMPFTMSLTYGNVVANYHNIPYAILLELILVTHCNSWIQWIKNHIARI